MDQGCSARFESPWARPPSTCGTPFSRAALYQSSCIAGQLKYDCLSCTCNKTSHTCCEFPFDSVQMNVNVVRYGWDPGIFDWLLYSVLEWKRYSATECRQNFCQNYLYIEKFKVLVWDVQSCGILVVTHTMEWCPHPEWVVWISDFFYVNERPYCFWSIISGEIHDASHVASWRFSIMFAYCLSFTGILWCPWIWLYGFICLPQGVELSAASLCFDDDKITSSKWCQ